MAEKHKIGFKVNIPEIVADVVIGSVFTADSTLITADSTIRTADESK